MNINIKNHSDMERAKKLKELKKLINGSKTKHYLRYWEIKNDRPTVMEETASAGDLTINFTGHLCEGDAEVYEKYDLEQLAEEQRKEVANE